MGSITLDQLNAASVQDAARLLEGVYEHSPWVAQAAIAQRPFRSLAHLKHALAQAVAGAGRDAQLALVRAHPQLGGKATVSRTLSSESGSEQSRAGLANCTSEEFARLQQLNAEYDAKFGFPFILAVRGPRGTGLAPQEIIATFARRLDNPAEFELFEALRNIHRIAELRLNDRFGVAPTLGNLVWDWAEQLAQHSDPEFAEQGQLTVTYLTDAHRACARRLSRWMCDCGFDEVAIDAVGNVVGVYFAAGDVPSPGEGPDGEGSSHIGTGTATRRRLLTGSHYDTVRNGGKYDGRLGIFTPMACVRELARVRRRLPFSLEVVGFAEEEGQRYQTTFLGSGALIGQFDRRWLDQQDAQGITMREAMQHAGLCVADIPRLRRDPSRYLGFVEVHIEQGPVLNELDLPLGVVTSINGGVRYLCEAIGMASHAGTTPMNRRRDAAAAVAEVALYVEQRATQDGDSVGTIGILDVPGGSTNVVPGRCQFTLDLRAPNDPQRDAMVRDVLARMQEIGARRGVRFTSELTMRAAAAPSALEWQQRWERAVETLGVRLHRMPSGAGHDAMKLHEVLPQAMLFVRGQNDGISHNPLEST
ncbi:MAG TPA: 2-oxo-4-hydroxy-4-carboxy-5-ureidoimidazoline decarboxylase, partial [Ramlibacter sp.]|nr:2-oxo-4-hydroxy-4-carboxy-5-ureidoimidazoline decarboxylase [Ramlibacter sp.]